MKLLRESVEIIKAMEVLFKDGVMDSDAKIHLFQNIIAMKDLIK